MKIKTVLLEGGSFNPIHQTGHIGSIKNVFETLNRFGAKVDEAWLLPAFQNPDKPTKGMASYHHRLRMCQIQAAPYKDWLKVCGFEGQIEAPHYTYAVLKQLIKVYPNVQFIWMMGSDNLVHFHEWEFSHDILQLCPIVVVGRPCSAYKARRSVTMQEHEHAVYPIGAPFNETPNIRFVDANISASATDIRQAILDSVETPDLNVDVRSYIDKHNLYR